MAAGPMVVVFFIVLSFIFTLQAFRDYRRRRGLPYPPGPRPLPIIGNLLDIPMESSWLTYSQLAKKYGTSYVHLHVSRYAHLFVGDVMSFHVLGRVVVILGSTEATKNLLGKRGNVYSDRPVIPFFEMYAHKVRHFSLPLKKVPGWMYNGVYCWRDMGNTGVSGAKSSNGASALRHCQHTASYKKRELAFSLLACCKIHKNGYLTSSCQFCFSLFIHIVFLNHTYYFLSFQGEQLLAMTYGYEAKGHHDTTIDAAKKLSDIGTRASLPGSLLVNEFPFRK